MSRNYEDPSLDDEYDDEDEGRLYRIVPRIVVAVAIGGFALLAWYAYRTGTEAPTMAEVPLIEADKSPIKSEPENPGGMDIPYQDKKVFDAATGTPPAETKDQLIPKPETPVAAPQPAPTQAPAPAAQNPVAETFAEEEPDPLPGHTPEPAPKAEVSVEQGVKVQRGGMPPAPATAPVEAAPAKPVTAAPVAPVSPQPLAALPPVTEKPATVKAEQAPKPLIESVPLQPKAEKPAETAAKGGVRVQLAALRSRKEADDTWEGITRKHAAIIAGKKPSVETADLGAKGTFYRLQIGGFASAGDAKSFCAKLTAAKQGCFLVK